MRATQLSLTITSLLIIVILYISPLVQNVKAEIKVSGGENHTLVLTENQFVWACGPNGDPNYATYYGVLGTGSSSYTLTEQTLTLVYGGDMYTQYLQDINNIAAGWMHSLALDVNGFVWSWGWNEQGQLGNNGFGQYQTTPVQVHDGEMNTASGYLENIIAISAGRSGRQSLALDANNLVYAWGYNRYGQCGNDENNNNKLTPVRVLKGQQETSTSGYLENIISIFAGADQSMALEKDDPNDPNFSGCVYN